MRIKYRSRSLKNIRLFIAGYIVFLLGCIGTAVYVAQHFIIKYW